MPKVTKIARRQKDEEEPSSASSSSAESIELLPARKPSGHSSTKGKTQGVPKGQGQRPRWVVLLVITAAVVVLLGGVVSINHFSSTDKEENETDAAAPSPSGDLVTSAPVISPSPSPSPSRTKAGGLKIKHPEKDNYATAITGFAWGFVDIGTGQLENACPALPREKLDVGVIPGSWHTQHPNVDFCAPAGRRLVVWVEGRPQDPILGSVLGTCSRCKPVPGASESLQQIALPLAYDMWDMVLTLESAKGTSPEEVERLQFGDGVPVRWTIAEVD